MSLATQEKPQSYHHGDLRNALIIAAVELIEEHGPDQFTMVDAARIAGVSNAAPYRHFKDKDELLQAVAHLGFLGLTEQIAQVAQTLGLGSMETIIVLGDTYVEYVTSRPQFYELMWGNVNSDIDAPNETELKSSGFYVLVDAVSAWGKVEEVAISDPVQIATYLWAMVHGLSSLTLHNHIDRFVPGANVKDMLRNTTETFLNGLRNPTS
jgi:AcrR family transcriptional regulator